MRSIINLVNLQVKMRKRRDVCVCVCVCVLFLGPMHVLSRHVKSCDDTELGQKLTFRIRDSGCTEASGS